jgi:pilus assembly protein CpaB
MRRPTIFLTLAMVAAVLAAIVVFSALKNREAQVQVALAQTQDIVVAARDVHLGEKLSIADVKLVKWSRQSEPVGAFTDPAMVGNSFARDELVAGQPVTQRNLISADSVPGVMPMIIPPGMRAMSVAVDEVGDISGFVKPRTHVDVLVAVAGAGANNDKPYSKIVLQNIEVIAVAQQIDKGKDEPEVVKVVTLLVTPHEAEKLGLATHDGLIRLAMRNYNDDKTVPTEGSDYADLLGRAGTALALNTQPSSGSGSASPLLLPPPRIFGNATGRSPFNVEIMRDGKSAETVSFVSAAANGTSSHLDSPTSAPTAPATSVVPAAPDASSAPAVTGSSGTPNQSDGASSASFIPVPKTLDIP